MVGLRHLAAILVISTCCALSGCESCDSDASHELAGGGDCAALIDCDVGCCLGDVLRIQADSDRTGGEAIVGDVGGSRADGPPGLDAAKDVAGDIAVDSSAGGDAQSDVASTTETAGAKLPDGVAWIHHLGTRLHMGIFDAKTGAVKWSKQLNAAVNKALPVDRQVSRCAAVGSDDTAYIAHRRSVSAVDAGGQTMWSLDCLGDQNGVPVTKKMSLAVGDDMVYGIDGNGDLLGVSKKGKLQFKAKFALKGTGGLKFCDPVVTAGGDVVVARDLVGFAVFSDMGAHLWAMPGAIGCPSVSVEGVVYNSGYGIEAVSRTGVGWSVPGAGSATPPAVLSQGNLFMLTVGVGPPGGLRVSKAGAALASGLVEPVGTSGGPWLVDDSGHLVYSGYDTIALSNWPGAAVSPSAWSGLDGGPANRRSMQ